MKEKLIDGVKLYHADIPPPSDERKAPKKEPVLQNSFNVQQMV